MGEGGPPLAVDEGSVDVGNYAFLRKTKKSSKNPYLFLA